jgi:predicted acetyltransferase
MGCLRTAFLGDREVTQEEADWRAKRLDLTRTYCAFEGDRLCGTSSTFPVELTIPGGFLDSSALTAVSVLPTHRRRGHLKAMMTAMLGDTVRRGEPVSILTASEWQIYGRFGFGVSTERVSIELRTVDVSFTEPRTGTIEMVGAHELRSHAPRIYEAVRPGIVGALGRNPEWWDEYLDIDLRPGATPAKNRVRVIWRDDAGEPQGYVIYDTTENWVDGRPVSEIQIKEIFHATPEAHLELWRYLCEVDLVAWVRANHRPVDDPLVHRLVDGRAVRTRSRFDHLWLRILDIEATLAARHYSAAGALVLEIQDPFYDRTSRVEIDGGPGPATVRSTTADPDILMDVTALGVVYMGGFSFATLRAARRLTEAVPGSVERADAMFCVRPTPYLTTNF